MEDRNHNATERPRADDSEGRSRSALFFNLQDGGDSSTERDVDDFSPENSDDEMQRVGATSPHPHSGLDQSAENLHGDMQQRMERRTNTGDDRSPRQTEAEPLQVQIGEMYRILRGVAESLTDVKQELRALKQGQSTEPASRSRSTQFASYTNEQNGFRDSEHDRNQNAHNTHRSTDQSPRSHIPELAHIQISSFTGKENWGVWIARFEAIACRLGLNSDDKLDLLIPRIEGRAADFVFGQLPKHMLTNYGVLVREINSRFRIIETPRSFGAKFSKRLQRVGETAEEFATDLQSLYYKAHGFRDQKTRDEDLVRRFLDGLLDDEIRFEVEYHKEPETIDEAVFHVVNFIQTRNCRDRDRRGSENMRVTREEPCVISATLSAPNCDSNWCNNDVHVNGTVPINTGSEDRARIIKQLLDKVDRLEQDKQNWAAVRGTSARDGLSTQGYHDNERHRGLGNENTYGTYSDPRRTKMIHDVEEHLNWSGPILRVGGRS